MIMPDMPLCKLISFVEEDAPFGDITSEAVITPDIVGAVIIARESLILAGLEENSRLCVHYGLNVNTKNSDGSRLSPCDQVMRIDGSAHTILLLERTLLNIFGRMSGIASRARYLQDSVSRVNPKVRICATRKTAPGLRLLDKKAAMIGGADPHRYSLSDSVLIKDNHRVLTPVYEAVRRAKSYSSYHIVEAEADTKDEALVIAQAGADVILLDNMTPLMVADTISLLKENGLRGNVRIEVSGGINEDNLVSYACLDIDLISLGILTHSIRNADLSLEILPES